MIKRLIIRNFKCLSELDCDLEQHLVITGPNCCGKTTLLQAIAFWSEAARYWAEHCGDLARDDDGNYPACLWNVMNISSMPLVDWDHLWTSKDPQEPVTIQIQAGEGLLGFEFLYNDSDTALIRPMSSVSESALERYIREPLVPVFIPPMSGVDLREPHYADMVIPGRLARAQGGTIFRNMLLRIREHSEKWSMLNEIAMDQFGIELTEPGARTEVFARYREGRGALQYDFASGAAGVLQVLMVYAAIIQSGATVVLIDEPFAHLHPLNQMRLYRDLTIGARANGWQLIMATHSETVINQVDPQTLRLLAGGLRCLPKNSDLHGPLRLSHVEILQAMQMRRILYLEGPADLEILRAWATVLDHPMLPFLKQPYWMPFAQESKKRQPQSHFSALRRMEPALKGVELRYGRYNGQPTDGGESQEGLKRLVWKQYEIENYLVYPKAILRWIRAKGDDMAAGRVRAYIKNFFPPLIFEKPFKYDYFEGDRGKDILGSVIEAAQIHVKGSDFYGIALMMRQDEVHPEVVEKLDAMAQHLGLST